MTSLNKLI